MTVLPRARWVVAALAVLGLINIGAALWHRDPIAGMKTLVWLLAPATPLAPFIFFGSLLALIAAFFIFTPRQLLKRLLALLIAVVALAVMLGFISYSTTFGMPHGQACGEGLLFLITDADDPFPGSPYGRKDFTKWGVLPRDLTDDVDVVPLESRTILIHADILDDVDEAWVRTHFDEGTAIALLGENIFRLQELLGLGLLATGVTR